MAQTERVTLKAVKQAELVHDEFEEVIRDGVVSKGEMVRIQRLLDKNLLSTSLADSAVNVSVSAIRGGVGTRHHRSLILDFNRLEGQIDGMPDFPDAA